MQAVCIDANVVLAARNANAKRHDTAAAIFTGIDTAELPRARLVNYVVPEILHPLQKRIGKAAASETLDRLQSSRGFEFVYVLNRVHVRGEQLFRTMRTHQDRSGSIRFWLCTCSAKTLNTSTRSTMTSTCLTV